MSFSAQRAPLYVLGLLCVLAVSWLSLSPVAPRADSEFRIYPKQGEQLGLWMTPGSELDEWRLESGFISESYGTFVFAHESRASMTVELHHLDTVTDSIFKTRHFALTHVKGPVDKPLVDHLRQRLEEHEKGWVWNEGSSDPSPLMSRRLLNLQVPVAVLLLLLMPLCLMFAYRSVLRGYGGAGSLPWSAVLIALCLAAAMRLGFAPLRMVVLYIGYDLTEAAITLDQIPRYGAGVPLFHHGVMELFGADHRVVLWLHALIGVLSLPLWAGLVQRLFKSHVATSFFAFGWALLPMAVAHDTSEANTVPILWWLGGACILYLDGLERKSPWAFVGAAVLASLCMVSRPEFGLLVPAMFVALSMHSMKGSPVALLKSVWPLIIAVILLVLPQALHLSSRASLLLESQSLPLVSSSAFNQFSFFDPELTPFALWPLFLLSLLSRGQWKVTLPWLALMALATAFTWADLCPANIARVQVPAALFGLILTALGAAKAMEWLSSRPWSKSAQRSFTAALVLGLLVSAVPATGRIWTPTYEDYEELLIREALDTMEDDALLVRLGYSDVKRPEVGSVVHLHFPDYLFNTGEVESRVRDVRDWLAGDKSEEAYFLLSVRCYTPELPIRTRAPEQMPMRKACRDIMTQFAQEPLFEHKVDALGDPNQTGYYGLGTSHVITLGLYRLGPVRP